MILPHQRRRTPLLLAFGAVAGASYYFFYPDRSRSAPTSSRALLSPSHFTPSKVLSNESCGPDATLLRLAVPPHLLPSGQEKDINFGPIWSIYVKDDDIQVERPYTPLEGVDDDGQMLFWVKKYPKGEVGRWLHSKKPNDTIEIRGPLPTFSWKDDGWDEVVMISGGTGITPFYQLFSTVISRQTEENKTRFTLLHSSRTPAELPPSRLIMPLVNYSEINPDKLSIQLYVDSDDGSPVPPRYPSLQIGRIGKSSIEQSLGLERVRSWWQTLVRKLNHPKPARKHVLFLVCGPEPMITAIAGPYGPNLSQGPVGGVLQEMGYTSDQVWKL